MRGRMGTPILYLIAEGLLSRDYYTARGCQMVAKHKG